ncbi:hypothetical protein U1Q18_026201, partial [Sarracenia purpurea var. burkii]
DGEIEEDSGSGRDSRAIVLNAKLDMAVVVAEDGADHHCLGGSLWGHRMVGDNRAFVGIHEFFLVGLKYGHKTRWIISKKCFDRNQLRRFGVKSK